MSGLPNNKSTRPLRMRRRAIAWFGGVLFLAGLPQVARAATRRITIGTASSMGDFIKSLATKFEFANPGVEVRVTLGASDIVASQAIRSAPMDLLVLADELAMSRVVAAGLVQTSSTRVLARNRLILLTRKKITTLADLGDKSFQRIAIGNPAVVPAGRYAREALAVAGVWTEIESKIVHGNNVRHALEYMLKGEVDAVVVYQSDLNVNGVDKLNSFPLAAMASYPVAILTGTREPELAAQFVAFALSDSSRAMLRQLRFELP